MKLRNRVTLGIAAVVLLALPFPGWGQDAGEDGPGLGVARVSLTNGDVSMRHGEEGDWVQATVNSPLVEGDTISTGPGSRAEVQLDYSNLIRLGPDTEVNIANLANRQFRVQVARGMVTYSELRGGEADVDLETPLVAVRPGKNGRYHVQVHGDDEVWVTVRKGEAQIASTVGVEKLEKGQRMIVRKGTAEEPEFQIAKALPEDEWDEFNERRDKQLNKSKSYRNVSRSIYGAEDLDDNGRWTYVTGYGNCWFPRVDAGWAPYRYGNWRYIDYYGWTWVSYEPWGWAPYHYGRWFHQAGFGWGWYPGPYYAPHYWRPALVSFFGYNSYSGFNIGFGFGGGHYYPYGQIGWVPLAPGERYHPWYRRGGGGFGGRGGRNSVIVNNNINIYNDYRNARVNNGTTVIDSERFARGGRGEQRSLTSGELRRASAMRGEIPVIPESESRGNVVQRASARAAGGSNSRQFFSTNRTRQNVERASFGQQRERVSQSLREFAEANPEATKAASAGRSGAAAGTNRAAVVSPSGNGGRSTAGTRSAIVSEPRSGSAARSQAGSASRSTSGGGAGFPSASSSSGSARSRAGGAGLSASPAAVQGSTTAGRATSGPGRSSAGNSSEAKSTAPAAAVRSTTGRTSGAAWRRFGGASSGSAGATVRSGRTPSGSPSTRSAPAGTSGSAGRSGASSSPSRWSTFSREPSGATVRSGRSENSSPSRATTRGRSFELGQPVLNGNSSSRSTAAPSSRSQSGPRSAGAPAASRSTASPRNFTPRSSSRATTAPSAAPQISSPDSTSGGRSIGRSRPSSDSSRFAAPRSSAPSTSGFTPRTASRVPDYSPSRSAPAARSVGSGRSSAAPRSMTPRSAPTPNRTYTGGSSRGRSAPSVSSPPRSWSPSGQSYGRGGSSAGRSASPMPSAGSSRGGGSPRSAGPSGGYGGRSSVGRSSAGSGSGGVGRGSGGRGRGR